MKKNSIWLGTLVFFSVRAVYFRNQVSLIYIYIYIYRLQRTPHIIGWVGQQKQNRNKEKEKQNNRKKKVKLIGY